MKILISLLTGYLVGCISPAAILSRIKRVELKQEGTNSLGATDTAMVLGRRAGVVVLHVDIMKSILPAKLVKAIFPQTLPLQCGDIILFPILVAYSQGSSQEICLAFISSCIIVWTHRDNLRRAFARKEHITVKDYIHKILS